MNRSAGTVGVSDASSGRSLDLGRLQQRHDLRAAVNIAEAYQRKRGVAADHGRRIRKQLQERFVEACAGNVLTHDPGIGVADFLHRIFGEPNQVRIPLFGGGGAVRHAVAELHQRVLNVPRLLVVAKIFIQLVIGELASEPGIPPEKERH